MRKDLGTNIIFLPQPVLIITSYDESGMPNAMNAAWGGQTDFDLISIALSQHKTTDNILKNKAFCVSFATKGTMAISDYFGIVSGNKENKIEKSNVKVLKSPYVNAPIILDYPLTLECEFVSYENEVLVGKVVNVSVDEEYLKDGKVDVDKLEVITYDPVTHVYREIGAPIGEAFKIGKSIK
ncbi:MAG: flavin reductase family protein [Acholeplasmatales bacterium]|nr:flavin reductase family protein [Acholeplasmatales bacterium]